MANQQRRRRLEDQIQREISDILRMELRDPRVGLVTVSSVELSRDLAFAKVYYTLLGSEEERLDTGRILKRASGFVRAALGKRISVRAIPEVQFVYDRSVEDGIRMSQLIDRAMARDSGPARED